MHDCERSQPAYILVMRRIRIIYSALLACLKHAYLHVLAVDIIQFPVLGRRRSITRRKDGDAKPDLDMLVQNPIDHLVFIPTQY